MAGLIHLFAAFVLLQSSLPHVFMGVMLIILLLGMLQIVRCDSHLPLYSKLTYHTTYWLLHGRHGEETQYEQARICFDGGLFILLQLSAVGLEKKLLIFKDQLTISQNRMLHVITKIGSKKKS